MIFSATVHSIGCTVVLFFLGALDVPSIPWHDDEMRGRRETSIILTIITVYLLLLCGAHVAAEESPAPPPLRVLVSASVPFFYLDAEGKASGYEHAIVASFAESLGRPLEIIWFPDLLEDFLDELETGTADLGAAALTITPKRSERFDFSRGHFPSLVVLVERRGEESSDFADLAGQRIITERGTTHEDHLEQIPGVVLVEYAPTETYEAAFRRVMQKEADGLVIDSAYYLWYAEDFPDLTITHALSERQFYGFALRKESPLRPQLDAHVEALQESGQLRVFLREAFGAWGEAGIDELAEGFLDPN